MIKSKYDKVIELMPKKIYFNAYSDKFFNLNKNKFWDNLRYTVASKSITTYIKEQNEEVLSEKDTIIILFEQVCQKNKIVISKFSLTLKELVEMLFGCVENGTSQLIFDINFSISNDEFFCKRVCSEQNYFCDFVKKQTRFSEGLKLVFEFDKEEITKALEYYKENETVNSNFGTTINAVNVFPVANPNTNNFNTATSFMNMDCGLVEDEMLVSTMWGIAINRNGYLYVFDKNEKRMINIPKMALTNFPIYVVPTPTLKYGDLIKLDGKYYFFLKKEGGKITVLDVLTDEQKKIYVAQNILEFTVYSKVITILDLK